MSTLLIISTPVGSATAAILCKDAHLLGKRGNTSQGPLSLTELIQERYFTKEQTVIVQDFGGRPRDMISQFYYRMPATGGYKIRTVRLGKSAHPLDQISTQELFQALVKESIEFVLSFYAEHRIWSADFRSHLYEQAIQDSPRSFYIRFEVFEPSQVRDVLRGTLKVIEASSDRNDELPVDTNLGIHLPFNGGLKFELGNFAIDKRYNKEAFSEILIQLMMHAQTIIERSNHSSEQMIYFTYADSLSYRMYRSLGFMPVPGFETPIQRDGTKWTPMGISAEGILRIPETMLTSRSYWEPEVLKELLDTFSRLDVYKKQKLQTSAWTLSNYWVLLRRENEKKGQQYRELIIQKPNFGEILARISIPFSFLPMSENSTYSDRNGVYKLRYQNGLLTVEMPEIEGNKILYIKVDPNFNSIESVQTLKDRMI